MNKQKILIADADFDFVEKIKNDENFKNVKVDFAEQGAEAQTLMKENAGEYIGIFINPTIVHPSGLSCVKFSHLYQPSVPIYLFDDITSPIDENINDEEIGISGTLAKPITFKDILKKIEGSISFFDEKAALGISELHKDQLEKEIEETDNAFCPIAAQSFVSGKKTLFDTYVKLRKDKFIKILQAGDNFEYDRLLNYLKKGVEFFYIRNEAREHYLSFCDKLSEVLVKKKDIPINKKFPHLFNQCDVTIRTMASTGVSNDNLSYAQRYITRLAGAMEQLKKENVFILDLMRNLDGAEHASSVVMIASMIANKMGMETGKSLEILGIACMFHDIGFMYDEEGNKIEHKYTTEELVEERLKSGKCFAEEKKMLTALLKEHAENGYFFLTNVSKFSPVICQIVKGHHSQEEKARGTYAGGAVHPMAEILEIADLTAKFLVKFKGKDVDPKFVTDNLKKISNIFPQRIREPFYSVFNIEK